MYWIKGICELKRRDNMGKEEAKRRIQKELDFAKYESENERNSEDIKTAYDYKHDAFETALQIIEEEVATN